MIASKSFLFFPGVDRLWRLWCISISWATSAEHTFWRTRGPRVWSSQVVRTPNIPRNGNTSAQGLQVLRPKLDQNAWQRVATYKSGSKQTWRCTFFVWNHMRKHRRIEHQPSFHFSEQLQPGFSCLLSSGSDSVLYSKFLCHIFHRAVSHVPVQHCCLEEDPSRPSISFLGLFVVWWTFCRSFQLVTRQGKRTKQWNEDKFIILRRRMISMQPCSWTNIRARRSTSARSETAPYSTQILPNPHYLFSVSMRLARLWRQHLQAGRSLLDNFFSFSVADGPFTMYVGALPIPCFFFFACQRSLFSPNFYNGDSSTKPD